MVDLIIHQRMMVYLLIEYIIDTGDICRVLGVYMNVSRAKKICEEYKKEMHQGFDVLEYEVI
jgi:hypothetical protein